MKRSTWDLDTQLGLWWYGTDNPGIGGSLREIPEDFEVTEIAEHSLSNGPYLICTLQKRNWDQHRAVKAVASGLGISHQRIGFAGTKDKKALTTQYISLYKVKEDDIQRLSIPDITLNPLGYTQHPIHLGDLRENQFSIRIRNIPDCKALSSVDSFSEAITEGIPNYIGYQRFGVTRPVTHRIGLEILKGDFRQAVRIMIGDPGSSMEEKEQEGRAQYLDTEDPGETLHLLPNRLSLERSVLHYLVNHPGDFQGAVNTLPRTLRSMYVSAVQSWLFNLSLSMRIQDGRPLNEPGVGDRLVWPDGRTDVVSQATMRAAGVQIKRNICSIALLLPGGKLVPGTGEDDQNIASLLEENGLDTNMFEGMATAIGTTFAGSIRPVLVKTKFASENLENDVRVTFSLPPGHYATTILREIMKSDPVSMV